MHICWGALLTGSVKGAARKAVLQAIKTGSAQVVVGTHALISAGVTYHNLGLTVTDEQHRFGVRQRSGLAEKGNTPHLLVMSATPIPRTLGLIIFGDLDISLLNEMPPGRSPVKTYLVGTDKRARMYGFIREHVDAHEQAYIVCPAIEEGPGQMAAVTSYYEEVAKPLLGTTTVGLLHGRMKPAEKNALMADFAAGEISVLCATTVIEVGVDVPNASIMVIENAERFGLSALHQLRGRVGRGAAQAHCILVSDSESENARARLSFLCQTQSGFDVAKYDLETRGPGDFFGSRQHGLPALNLADLATDMQVVQAAQKEAAALLRQYPTLDEERFAPLREAVDALFTREGEAPLN
ncbi:hypothetical protein LJB77_01395 [Ruminococcaceae bacterium OttesenSCG-928-N02]|nr:hypothetical protein [Ruminococcaceae bacterium OttesenSCG-928-N02]